MGQAHENRLNKWALGSNLLAIVLRLITSLSLSTAHVLMHRVVLKTIDAD